MHADLSCCPPAYVVTNPFSVGGALLQVVGANPCRTAVLFSFIGPQVGSHLATISFDGAPLIKMAHPAGLNAEVRKFTRELYGDTIANAIFTDDTSGINGVVTEIIGCPELLDCCGENVAYSTNTVKVTTLAASGKTKALNANIMRRSLLLSFAGAAGDIVDFFRDPTGGQWNFFLRFQGNNNIVLPYRDYGPLITGEIYVVGSAAGLIVTLTEIYQTG